MGEFGYNQKGVKVDLTNSSIERVEINEDIQKKYIGGSGFGVKFLYDLLKDKTIDPFQEENPIIFSVGPLTGTYAPTSGRHEITTKSPLTGIFGEGDAGGFFGTNLKRAGIDSLIITGKSSKPSYILIEDDDIKILNGKELWGKDTIEADSIIKEKHGKKFVTSLIGPAGEKMVKLSNIVHDGSDARVAGRGGLGAVFGSKNLKGVAVYGSKKIKIYDEEKFKELLKETSKKLREETKNLNMYGTAGGVIKAEATGDFPVKNWQSVDFEEGAKKISGDAIYEKMLKANFYCAACPIGCGRIIELENEKHRGIRGAGLEYESIATLGGLTLIDDLEAVNLAGEYCNLYGLDTISTGSVIAYAMEAYEKGLINKDLTGGLEIKWAEPEILIELIKQIGEKRGFGALLSNGVREFAKKIKGDGFAIHVKGLEFPAHDPRAYNSLALSYATSNRGACHLQSYSYSFERSAIMPEIGINEPVDRFSKEKEEFVKITQDIMTVYDSVKACKFAILGGLGILKLTEFFDAAVGFNFKMEDLIKAGERIFNLKRLFNVEAGITCKDDTIPERILALKRGRGALENLPPFNQEILQKYYKIRGWDPCGIPTEEKLKELEII